MMLISRRTPTCYLLLTVHLLKPTTEDVCHQHVIVVNQLQLCLAQHTDIQICEIVSNTQVGIAGLPMMSSCTVR
jgi:hypothetical protein